MVLVGVNNAHCAQTTRNFLNRSILRGCEVALLSKSFDMVSTDFFYWNYLKY